MSAMQTPSKGAQTPLKSGPSIDAASYDSTPDDADDSTARQRLFFPGGDGTAPPQSMLSDNTYTGYNMFSGIGKKLFRKATDILEPVEEPGFLSETKPVVISFKREMFYYSNVVDSSYTNSNVDSKDSTSIMTA